MTRRVTRRDLLRFAGTGALAIGVARVVAVPDASASALGAGADTSTGGSVAAIGRRYRAITPKERSRETLGRLLPTGAVDATGGIDWSVVAAATGRDFTRGDVVTVDGWRLARSAARAAAYLVSN